MREAYTVWDRSAALNAPGLDPSRFTAVVQTLASARHVHLETR